MRSKSRLISSKMMDETQVGQFIKELKFTTLYSSLKNITLIPDSIHYNTYQYIGGAV